MLPISNAQSQNSNSGKVKRIAVIGAGMAGLAAANHLQKLGHNVTVIEGRERIGGRIWTSTQWSNMPLDLGATWIHGTQGNPLTALADRKWRLLVGANVPATEQTALAAAANAGAIISSDSALLPDHAAMHPAYVKLMSNAMAVRMPRMM